MDKPQHKRLAKFKARRDELSRTARCRQLLFVPTPGDAGRAFIACFASVTGSSESSDALTEGGDGTVGWRSRVALNEYEYGWTLLLPGDVLLDYSSRDDVVQPPECVISITAATPEVAAIAQRWLIDAGTPLLPLVITRIQELKPPAISESWTARDWSLTLSSISSGGREPEHQIYVPNHDVGPWMGRETACAPDHPELVQLIASLCEQQAISGGSSSSSGDFRFQSRGDFDRVREALRDQLFKR